MLRFSIMKDGKTVVTKVTPELIDLASMMAIHGEPPVFRTPVPQVSNVGAKTLMVLPPVTSSPIVFW